MAIRSRALLGLLLAVALAVCCLMVGTAVGALLLVPADAGLAGPVIALGYGLVAALVGVVAAVMLARWLSVVALRRALAAASVAAFLGLCLVGYRVYESRQVAMRQRAAMEPSPFQQPYELLVEVTDAGAEAGPEVQEIRFAQTAEEQRVVWITRDAEPQRCEDALVGLEGVDLAARLQAFAPRARNARGSCPRDEGARPVLYTVTWRASARLTSAGEGELTLDAGCLRTLVSARDLIDQVRAIHHRAGPSAICTPLKGGLAARQPGPGRRQPTPGRSNRPAAAPALS